MLELIGRSLSGATYLALTKPIEAGTSQLFPNLSTTKASRSFELTAIFDAIPSVSISGGRSFQATRAVALPTSCAA